MTGNHPGWTSHILPEGTERVAAWAITVAIHILVIAYLTRALSSQSETEPSYPGTAMRVEFLSLPLKPVAPDTPPTVVRNETSQGRREKSRRSPSARVAVDAQPSNDKDDSLSDDTWRDLSAPRQAVRESATFKREFIRRNPPPILATVPRLQLTFQDASLGGRLTGMTLRTICRELKEALAAKPANAAAVISSMQEHGCHKQ